jgi:Arc/MetJ family transcription regulator
MTFHVREPSRRQGGWISLDLTYAEIKHHNAYMRTTLNVDPSLVRRAARLTGVSKKTALVRMGLEALIARESARRLARLGGTEPGLRAVRRRRPGRVT